MPLKMLSHSSTIPVPGLTERSDSLQNPTAIKFWPGEKYSLEQSFWTFNDWDSFKKGSRLGSTQCVLKFSIDSQCAAKVETTDIRDLEEIVKKPNIINYTDKDRALLYHRITRMTRAVSEMEIFRTPSGLPPWSSSHPHGEWACRGAMPQQEAIKGPGTTKGS